MGRISGCERELNENRTKTTAVQADWDEKWKNSQQNESELQLHAETLSDLKSLLDVLRKKLSVLEFKQESLNKQLAASQNAADTKETNIESSQQRTAAVLLSEAKETMTAISRERTMMRKDFGELSNALNTEFCQLRTENELLMAECQKMYSANRQLESGMGRLKEGYKSILESMQRRNVSPVVHREISGTEAGLDAIRSRRRKSGEKLVIPPITVSEQKSHYRRVSHIGSRRTKLGENPDEEDNNDLDEGSLSPTRNLEIPQSNTSASAKSSANKTFVLNRFRHLMKQHRTPPPQS